MKRGYWNSSLFRIIRFNKKYLHLLTMGVVATLLVSVNRIYVVKILGKLVDGALDSNIDDITGMFGILVLSVLLLAGFSAFKNHIIGCYTQKSMYEIRNHTLSIINHVSMEKLGFGNVGALITRMNNCLSKTENLFNNIIPDTLYKVLVGVLALIIGMSINWRITIVLVAISLLCCFLEAGLTKTIESKEMYIQKSKEKIGGLNNDVIMGNNDIKSFNLYKRFEKVFNNLMDVIVKKQFQVAKLSALHEILIDSIRMVMQIGVVLYGLYFVYRNEMTFGELIVFQQISDLIQSLIHIDFLEIWRSGVGVRLLYEIWDVDKKRTEGDIERGHDGAEIIRFNNVSFRYSNGENDVLKGVSFKVYEGESIGVVGSSGSGKSTIAKLICGLHTPVEGSINFKGYDYREWNRSKLRENISIVEQNAYLFPVSVYDNIASGKYGYGEYDRERLRIEVESAAERAGLKEFIESSSDGYERVVGEKGSSISGGQNQRIAIARAFMKDADLLILDEPTSSLDVEVEKKIGDSIEALKKDRTSIIIAHRLSTLRNVSRILVLHKGEIVEEGTHQQLIQKKGRYFKLYNTQLLEEGGIQI